MTRKSINKPKVYLSKLSISIYLDIDQRLGIIEKEVR